MDQKDRLRIELEECSDHLRKVFQQISVAQDMLYFPKLELIRLRSIADNLTYRINTIKGMISAEGNRDSA